ncbi:putative kinesin [Trypanosoma grayi]|uniref:putative kinesin n=1 Tax=Trypanosoma grayi TaxID=71804 RepID=UPI0004F4B55B|nr:putative kinesin [Trypanosoma grayi]KEG06072.1 putative kinesin [Trypanosoma grayi]
MRTTGATNINEHSSRSHSIFTIFNHERGSKLNLVDLAGSERNKKTQNVGQRFRESIAINGGLLALGNVIRALSRNHFQCPDNPRHVPYRSSKLTRLLQDSLGGNSSTLLIACVAADLENSDEATRTLQYSALAMHILNEPLPQFDEEVAATAAAAAAAAADHSNGSRCVEGVTCDDSFEVADLRQQVAALQDQVQRCHQELRNDKKVFAQQIKDMRLLLEDNELLRRRVAFLEGRPATSGCEVMELNMDGWRQRQEQRQNNQEGHQCQPQQQRQWWSTETLPPNPNYVQDSLQLRGIQPQQGDRDATGQQKIPPPHGAVWGDGERAMGRGNELKQQQQHQQQQKDYVKTTLAFNRYSEAVASVPAAERPTSGDNGGRDGLGGVDGTVAAREEQLSLLAKEALYYQSSNSELRRRLRSLLALYEAQQRETAMLRLEVNQIEQLFAGAPHA